jgi:hypothetical protein
MTAAPQFLRDLEFREFVVLHRRVLKVCWNVTPLLDFGASQYTARASISLRHFSNASLCRHVRRLKRDLIPQLERVMYRWRASVYLKMRKP